MEFKKQGLFDNDKIEQLRFRKHNVQGRAYRICFNIGQRELLIVCMLSYGDCLQLRDTLVLSTSCHSRWLLEENMDLSSKYQEWSPYEFQELEASNRELNQ